MKMDMSIANVINPETNPSVILLVAIVITKACARIPTTAIPLMMLLDKKPAKLVVWSQGLGYRLTNRSGLPASVRVTAIMISAGR